MSVADEGGKGFGKGRVCFFICVSAVVATAAAVWFDGHCTCVFVCAFTASSSDRLVGQILFVYVCVYV